jgi:hypothetical protein
MCSLGSALVVFGLAIPTLAQKPATSEVNLTATSANVGESGIPVKVRILRWSTDEERNPFVAALTSPPSPAGPDGAAASPPVGAAANPSAPADVPAGAATNAPAAAGDRGGAARGARGGAARGGAGRGGRGGTGRGGRGDAPPDPIAALTAAIGSAPTLGYIWTNDVTGYSIKYAYHASLPDGGERIILATDRRLGAYTTAWNPVAAAAPATDYEFTLIEIRLDAKGLGEGKSSLTTKVILDNAARTVALENSAATPAILKNVKR